MFSGNSICPLSLDGTLCAYISCSHDYISRYNFCYQKDVLNIQEGSPSAPCLAQIS